MVALWRQGDTALLGKAPLSQPGQRVGVENPIVGPPYGDLINLFTGAPTGLLSQVFFFFFSYL